MGAFIDRQGKRRFFIVFTSFLFTLSCFLFGFMSPGEEYEDEDEMIIYEPNMFSIIPLFLLGNRYIYIYNPKGLSFSFYSTVVIPSV